MEKYGIPQNPALRTTSRLRKWWLHSVWGYKILGKRAQARTGVFGPTFDDVYVLLPKHTRRM